VVHRAAVTDPRAASRPSRALRRAWPWLLGLVIVVAMATRVPFAAFRQALGHGPHLALAATNVAINVAVLASDSIATWVGLIATRIRRRFGAVMVARGATYLLFVLNYAVGQGGFGYYLYRTGVAPLRATGAALFLLGTNFATLIVVTTIAWAVRGPDAAGAAASATMWWTLLGACGAYAVYLAVIAAAPRALARRQLLAPLFDAGLRGHLLAMVGRLPHVAVVVLAMWSAMRVWGIGVPLAVGLTTLPVVVIVSALPLSPAGLGTTQAALVYFFSGYAAGATDADRSAAVLAFALVHFVYGVLASTAVGVVCAPLARRSAQAELLVPAAPAAPDAPASAPVSP
jgi:hypothetical protein